MIARALIPILLLILLPDLYREWRSRSRKKSRPLWRRLIAWLPSVAMTVFTVYMALQPGFAPGDMNLLFVYLFVLCLVFVPRLVYVLCSLAGRGVARLTHSRRNYGNLLGLLLVPLLWYVLIYGSTRGFSQLEVRHVELAFSDLPPSFDGYRIVQFSDAHVGSYGLSRQHLLRRAVDSINAQQPDMIVFTGDLQNRHPQELYPQIDVLSLLRAGDGVFSVLGNHDYAEYIDADEVTKTANCRETQSLERQMGWTLLMNAHRTLHRGNTDSIVIAGMENDGTARRMPQRGDVARTLAGVQPGAFVIMLQHDPTCWARKIQPESNAQLTLSGHTHGGQFALLGFAPVALAYNEFDGLYYKNGRMLYVTAGLGGLSPFRFGVPGEIVVITLRRK